MSQAARAALEYWFEQNEALWSGARRVVVLRAEPHPMLKKLPREGTVCYQPWRPDFTALKGQGYSVAERFPEQGSTAADLVLIFGTKHKHENHFLMALASTLLREGGIAVCALSNELGAERFSKELRRLFGEGESLSKSKARVFWSAKGPELDQALQAEWLAGGELQPVPETELRSRPGIFGWNKIDRGSALLAEAIAGQLSGCGADLGVGYGYLAACALRDNPGISEFWLFEAEGTALDAAKENLTPRCGTAQLQFEWSDVTAGVGEKRFDFIISNPPFHQGRVVRVDIGEAFLDAAHAALRPGGKLWVVANNQIPYERALRAKFGEFEKISARDGFKVLHAVKGR